MEEGALLQKSFPKERASPFLLTPSRSLALWSALYLARRSLFLSSRARQTPLTHSVLSCKFPRSFFLPPSLYASFAPLSISLYFSASNLLHLSLIRAFCLSLFIFYLSFSVCRVPVVRCPAFCRERRKHEENINKTRLMSQSRRERERQAKREEEIVRKGCLVSLGAYSRSI